MLQAYSVALVLIALLNTYFVVDGTRRLRSDPKRSPLLLALLAVKIVVWLTGLVLTVLLGLEITGHPAPVNVAQIIRGIVLLAVLTLPAFLHYQMVRVSRRD